MLPKYIAARDIAKLLGPAWSTERVTRVLRHMGIAQKIGESRGWWVTPQDLAGCWTDMYEEILGRLEEIKATPERAHGRLKGSKKTANGYILPAKGVTQCEETYTCAHEWDDADCCVRCGITPDQLADRDLA